MPLGSRIRHGPVEAVPPLPGGAEVSSAQALQLLKARIHARLLDRLDLAKVERLPADQLEAAIAPVIRDVLREEGTPLTREASERITREIVDETVGLGPLEPLLADATVSDILVNGAADVWVERQGTLEKTGVSFKDDRHLLKIIDRIVSRIGRRVDESSPMVDARLQDGSRVNVILPPLALDGPMLSVRKFRRVPYQVNDLVRLGTLTPALATYLEACVEGRLNVLISGGTGSGKTTLLNALSRFISPLERIVTIEDAAELQLQQSHVVRLETRIPNVEGKGRVSQRELLVNTLRMRPDRIIMGECRGDEALDMLQAMNTGHEGSMTTLHANTTRDAIRRLETLVQMAGLDLGTRTVRELIASALHVIVQQQRLPDGKRHVIEVSEITGMEGDTVSLQPLFLWAAQGVDEAGNYRGQLRATGLRSHFAERLAQHGIELTPALFLEER